MPHLKVLYRDVDRMPYLGVLRHLCRRQDLELELIKAEGREFGELLQRSEVDVIAENYWGLQSFRAQGEPFISLVSAVSFFNERLFIRPDLAGLQDLKDRKFAIRETGPQQFFPLLWLRDHELRVEPVVYSERDTGRWGHYKKVVDGECAGCFVTYLYAHLPRAAGLKEIPIDRYGFIGNVTLTVHQELIDGQPDLIQTIVDAAFGATRLFKQDRAATLDVVRGEPLELLRTQLDVPDEAALDGVYDILRQELSDIPVPTPDAIWNVWRMRLDTAPELRDFNPLLMWDLSFARQAQRRSA